MIRKVGNLLDKLINSIAKNPLAWLFFALFVTAISGNYSTASDLHRVCDLISEDDIDICMDGDCNVPANPTIKSKHQYTIKDEIDAICYRYEHDPSDDER